MSNAGEKRIERAQQALDAKDYETAARLFEEDLRSGHRGDDPIHLQYVRGRLGFALLNLGRGPEAQDALEQSLFADETFVPASVPMLGQLYIATDNWAGLERLFRRVLGGDRPEDYAATVEQMIGRAADTAVELAAAGVRDETAITRAEDLARRYAPASVLAVRRRHGQVLEALGETDAAIAAYSAVAEPGAADPSALERLLVLMERAGRTDEALKIVALHLPTAGGDLRLDLTKRQQRLTKPRAVKRAPALRARRGTRGEELADATDAEAFLALEEREGIGGANAALDNLTSRLLTERLSGQAIGAGQWSADAVRLHITDEERSSVSERFNVAALESRGIWFMPEQISVGTDVLTPLGTESERARGTTATNPEVVYLWSLFVPLYRALEKPFALRERAAGQDATKQKAAWRGIADLFESLGLDARIHLQSMSYGGGWSRLTATERRSVQERLGAALQRWAPEAAQRFRAIAIRDLARSYYDKADKDGRALRSKVITSVLRQPFIAYFGGDWIAFVDYLGEQLHPSEQIQTALPETKLTGPTAKSLEAKVAAGLIPAGEAERIVSSFWGSAEAPFEARVNLLRRYWSEFDQIHAQQASGMMSLWGLVEEQYDLGFFNNVGDAKRVGMYRQRFSPELLAAIDDLWDDIVWQRDPAVRVSNPQPHITVAEAIGPAIEFWHGAALTAWFVCEGPYSRTSLEDMEEYYADRGLGALAKLGAPVDATLFRDLLAAQKKLRPRPPRPEDQRRYLAEGMEVTVTLSMGPPRMDGFEHLRDVITRHRQAWAERYLVPYLHARWQEDTQGAAVLHHRMIGQKGKPPTLKEFAKAPVRVTVDRWFAGDIDQLYRTLGESCPTPTRDADRLMPRDSGALIAAVALAVHSLVPERFGDAERDDWDRKRKASELGTFALHYVQTKEGLDRSPTLKEVGTEKFERAQAVWRVDGGGRSFIFGDDQDQAFSTYAAIVEEKLAEVTSGTHQRVPKTFLRPAPSPRQVEIPTSYRPVEAEKPKKQGLFGRLFGREDR